MTHAVAGSDMKPVISSSQPASSSSSASASFSTSTLSSNPVSGSLHALKREHETKVTGKKDGVRFLTAAETEFANLFASPHLTSKLTYGAQIQLDEVNDALKQLGANPDPSVVHEFEFSNGWEKGSLIRWRDACNAIDTLKKQNAPGKLVDYIFGTATTSRLDPYHLKYLYEQQTSSTSSSSLSGKGQPPSSSASAAASTDDPMEAAIVAMKAWIDTDQKGDALGMVEADFRSIAEKYGVNHIALMGAFGFSR